jgi:hypothetical protein
VISVTSIASSVEDPGRCIPDPTIFSSWIRVQTFFHPGSYRVHKKCGMLAYFFLASYAFMIKVLVMAKKIRDPEKNSFRIQG